MKTFRFARHPETCYITPMLDGVIFDFDGVVVDSEPCHWAALNEVFFPWGLQISREEYDAQYLGFDDRGAFRARFQQAGRPLTEDTLRSLVAEKGRTLQRLVETRGIQPFPGVVELLDALHREDVPLALCTGATQRDVDVILHQLRIGDVFDTVVTANDVQLSKPDPASYRLAFDRLRQKFPGRTLQAGGTLAVEDSLWGIQAARDAGLKVLAVANTYAAEPLRQADFVLPSLAGITPDHLRDLLK